MKTTLAVLICALSLTVANAAPLNVRIDDHVFSFDVPYRSTGNTFASYDFRGAAADRLYVNTTSNNYVISYSYNGTVPTVPANTFGTPPAVSPSPYPLVHSSQFAGALDLEMFFNASDGPYVDSTGSSYQVSLTGTTGHIKITGSIATQGFPGNYLYPSTGEDITLLDIAFTRTSLLARQDSSQIDQVEGIGTLNTLLGVPVAQDPSLPETAEIYFRFWAGAGDIIFPNLSGQYNPVTDYSLATVNGHIAGQTSVPEPATLAMIFLGSLGLLLRVRR